MVGARDGAGVVLDIRPVADFDVRGASVISSNGQVALVIDRPGAERLLSGVRRAGFDQIDVVIMESSSRRARIALSSLQSRHRVGLVLAASGLEGAILVKDSTELRLGDVLLHVTRRGAGLAVEITARGSFPEG